MKLFFFVLFYLCFSVSGPDRPSLIRMQSKITKIGLVLPPLQNYSSSHYISPPAKILDPRMIRVAQFEL